MSDTLRPHGLQHASSWSFFKLTSIESVMPSSYLILCHPLLLLPSTFPSIRVSFQMSQFFPSGGKYWLKCSPSNEYSGLISFMIDWFDLLAVQGTLKSLLSPTPQFRNINSSVLSLLYDRTLTSIHDYWKNCCCC